MRLWNYCAICGERIEVGEPCIGVEKNSELIGDSICLNCAKIENLPDGKGPVSITDLLARAEAAEARAEKAERERDAAVRDLRQMCVGGNTCAFCKYGRNCGKQGPGRKTVEPCWEWRGQKEE